MRFLADESFNGKIHSGLRAALPDLDLLRVQDTEMYQATENKKLVRSDLQFSIIGSYG